MTLINNRYLLIFIGAIIGASLRMIMNYGMMGINLPYLSSTFIVNMAGSFFIGLAYMKLKSKNAQFLFITGLLGTFTSFSALTMELYFGLYTSQFLFFVIYLALNMLGGLIMVYLGAKIGGKKYE
ncbi:fluoride efflux transporter FluC [Phocicoccus pinnipedialis]|nr:CrcB family protein [Jeotgalicoccus pinnipedialis]